MFFLEILIAPLVILAGLLVVCIYMGIQARRVSWKCNKCGKVSNPAILPLLLAPHTHGQKHMRCPYCKQKAFLKPVAKQKWQ